MSTPPPQKPPEPPQKESGERADLSHFRPKAEQDGAPPPKQGRNIADALADAIKKTQTSIQAKAHKPHI
ncbi:MAG: hypothetical protein HAW59_00100, partial [Betaproteobacteria bacterium]|nr:hypothetical protein [Betaproteobacteria bacterium]